ncbi:MAG: N-acetylmuramoyl-L-alanine amidase [Bradymonadaceae bacterium]|nr:N-acetylmuramoyl-L-alanine amidase [Lujinxingiaceae bacterium]
MSTHSWTRLLPALLIGAVLMMATATPATALLVPLRGIDLTTVLTLQDHSRKIRLANSDHPVRTLQSIRTIVLDAGHGGENSGATGVAGIREKHLTLDLAYAVRALLQERYPHARIVMTRYWDTSLELTDRVHMANLVEADLFVSLHYNAAVHERAVGFETYFLLADAVTPGKEQVVGAPLATASHGHSGIERRMIDQPPVGLHGDALVDIQQDLKRARLHGDSGLLAESVQSHLARHLRSTNRGVKQADFGVLRGALMPAIVVEAGFLTHPVEGKALVRSAHRHKVATAIVEAVEHFDKTISKRED